jgi:hypothetical protein
MLFKVARDKCLGNGKFLYGIESENTEFAMKAMAHEMTGASHYAKCILDLQKLYFKSDEAKKLLGSIVLDMVVPMQTLIDFKGEIFTQNFF